MFWSIQAAVTETIDWVACSRQKFISHGFEGWEVQDRGTGRFGVWSGCLLAILFICSHIIGGARELPVVSSCEVTNPVHVVSTLMT